MVPRRRSRKHDKMIAAAKQVFFEQGYASASVERITILAGVSKATIYSSFRSKEELLLAVVEDIIDSFRGEYLSAVADIASFSEWLTALGAMIVRKAMLPEVMALERLIIAETPRFPELGKGFLELSASSLRLFVVRFEEAIAAGELRSCDPVLALEQLVELCTGSLRRDVLFNRRPIPEDEEVDRHIHQAVDIFLHGYGT